MGFAVLLALSLIVGAVVAVVAQRRPGRARPRSGRDALSDLDAEADANRWVVRLGQSLSALDVRTRARADTTAAQALMDACERLGAARGQLAAARTVAEYEDVARTAVEGLLYVGVARVALGLDRDAAAAPREPERGADRGGLVPTG